MSRPGLLAALTVADFGWAVAGPVLGRFLAHHGATVIKIESNSHLDAGRASTPFAGRPSRNRSGFFDQHNAGKQSVTINLQRPEGRALARRLALACDVVNENFAPGVMDRLGLGYKELSAERPELVMVSQSMQGQTGPHAGHPGFGTTLQGLVGLCHLTGWPDREPVGTGEPYTDTVAPILAGTALMAALAYRRRTGRGTHVDLSQFEALAHVLAPALLHVQVSDEPHVRRGNAGWSRAPEGVYPCSGRDRWCAISVNTDEQWRSLAALIGFSADLPPDRQDLAWRRANLEAIERSISAWTSTRDPLAAQAALQAAGVPGYIVANAHDLVVDHQLRARGHFVPREHPAMGEHEYELPPFRLKEHAVVVARSPLIGEHTDAVLTGLLGMSEAEIVAAREAGALE
jgi:benzylsuccinate CoA-transferase BbsF subunit